MPKGTDLHLIVDNYATHKHQNVKAWLAHHSRFHLHFAPTGISRIEPAINRVLQCVPASASTPAWWSPPFPPHRRLWIWVHRVAAHPGVPPTGVNENARAICQPWVSSRSASLPPCRSSGLSRSSARFRARIARACDVFGRRARSSSFSRHSAVRSSGFVGRPVRMTQDRLSWLIGVVGVTYLGV
jgi:hypothetical protein